MNAAAPAAPLSKPWWVSRDHVERPVLNKGKVRKHRAAVKKAARSDEEWEANKIRAQAARPNAAEDRLENELHKVESQLDAMRQELEQVQKEREVLESQRRVLKAVAPVVTNPACSPSVPAAIPAVPVQRLQAVQAELDASVLENCDLRGQIDRLREALVVWESRSTELEQKLRALESSNRTKDALPAAAAAAHNVQHQEVGVLRQKYHEAQDELDGMRALIEDQASHLEGYRNKYLVAQQRVEEQRRQLDHMEADQDRITDQVQAEMHRAKAELEEKLQELAPLPDIVKVTQAKLQEEKQLRLIAEHNCADLNRELSTALEKVAEREKEMTSLRLQMQAWLDERQSMLSHLDAYERKCNKLRDEIKWYKQGMQQLEEAAAHSEQLYEETAVELARVRAELEAGREQAGRHVARLRDQMDTMKRSFQSQIGELEQQLAHSRASAATTLKEKEVLQNRLQNEISSITQSFGQTQDRIMNLQNVVDFVKSNLVGADITSSDLASRT